MTRGTGFAICLLLGGIYDRIITPIKNAWLKFKYRKQAAEVRRKYDLL